MRSNFFHIRRGPDRIETEGSQHFHREHPVDRSDGTADSVFARWDWDGEILNAANCRFGIVPLYYFETDDTFCIADSIQTLLDRGAPRQLDDVALSVFVRRLNFLGNDTPFKAIRCLPPNARLIWKQGKLNIESSAFHAKPLHLKPAAILEGIDELFAQSIARRLPKTDRFTVPISGGKDSRRILFELVRQKHRPRFCVTSLHPPPRPNGDAAVASIIAERLGIEHHVLPLEQTTWEQEKCKNERIDFSTPEHAWVVPMSGYLEKNVETSYDGLNIDCNMYGDKRAGLFADGRIEELAGDFLGDSEAFLARSLRPETYKRFSRDKAVHRMAEELKLHANEACPTTSFLFWSRMRRAVAPVPFGLLRGIETVHTPFLDKEYFEFVMSIPEPILVGSRVYKEAIAKSYPEWADIPYADSSLSTAPDRNHNRKYLAKLLKNLSTSHRNTGIINVPKVLPSIAKAMISGSQERFSWIQPHLLTHLLQLEELTWT